MDKKNSAPSVEHDNASAIGTPSLDSAATSDNIVSDDNGPSVSKECGQGDSFWKRYRTHPEWKAGSYDRVHVRNINCHAANMQRQGIEIAGLAGKVTHFYAAMVHQCTLLHPTGGG